jgi:uncharacterized protein YndB with AHSA1/START domain
LNVTLPIAPVRKTVIVKASPQRAFDVFTAGIDRWWPKTHHLGATSVVEQIVEPFVGGRWYTKHAGGEEAVVGHVLVWEPGERFVCTWEISADWKPNLAAPLASEVEVAFYPEPGGCTRVELEHRGFERMGREAGGKMRGSVDSEGGWTGILDLYLQEIEKGE